jgi:hypothetical protein
MIRTTTGAQRYNARKDKIFDQARALKYANAYPRLVEELRKCEAALRIAETVIARGGNEQDQDVSRQVDDCAALLRELGEVQLSDNP